MLLAGATQLRAGMGGTVGFDYPALKLLARDYGVQTTPAFWRKARAVENVIRKNEQKKARETERALRAKGGKRG